MAGKGKGRKGKKQPELPLVKPEPPELDEAEAAALWDQIGSIQPNPLSAGGPDYDAATKKAFDAGPTSPYVIGMLSPVVPILGPPSAKGTIGATGAMPAGVLPPPASPSPQPGDGGVTSSFTTSSAPRPMSHAPKPPPRHIAPEQRANFHIHGCEKSMRDVTKLVVEHLETQRGFWLMMGTEICQYFCEKKAFMSAITMLEVQLYHNELRNDAFIDNQDHEFNTEKFRLEALMDALVERDEEVQAALDEKRLTLEERRQREDQVYQLQRAHTTNLKQLGKDLKADRDRLEEMMNQRLTKTADEMSKLTAAQREERQKKAQEESNRLVAELSVLEKRSKQLNDRSMRLQQQSDATRRDRELEQHRRTLLIQKNHKLGESVKKVVGELQELEQRVAERQLASATGLKAAHELAMDRVDQQYESIAYLRTELEKVRSDTESVRASIRQAQRHLLADAGSRHLPITLPPASALTGSGGGSSRHAGGDGVLAIEGNRATMDSTTGTVSSMTPRAETALQSLNDDTAAAVRAVVLDAIRDTNDAMQRTRIHGCSSVYELHDPTEKQFVQKYVAKRVSKLLSCIYPSAPPFSFLRTAAQNPSSLATSL